MMKGIFIAIEGQDGTGKTTFIQRIQPLLHNAGLKVYTTKEPTSNPIGELIKRHEFKGLVLAQLISADRLLHLENEIYPSLGKFDIVITDRYLASSYVFQSFEGLSIDIIKMLNQNILMPDSTIFLTADIQIIKNRLAQRNILSRMEKTISPEEMEDLYKKAINMLKLGQSPNIIELNNNNEIDLDNNLIYAADVINRLHRGMQ